MTEQTDVNAICEDVYKKTAAFYAKIQPVLKIVGNDFGYKILYGPPKVNPPILFIGYNPGGVYKDAKNGEEAGERIGWPKKHEYADEAADYRLAKNIRKLWNEDKKFLSECVSLNYLFIRFPDKKSLPKYAGIEAFCAPECERIVRILKPKLIVVIGITTLHKKIFKASDAAPIKRGNGDRLIQEGELWGLPAVATMHLSGAQISNEDMARISGYFKDKGLAG